MDKTRCVTIVAQGKIDRVVAESLSSKIRAAIINDIGVVILDFELVDELTSAEFLAFLSSTRNHLKNSGGTLKIVNAKGKILTLLKISRLNDSIEQSATAEVN